MSRVELQTNPLIPPIQREFSGAWIPKEGEQSTIKKAEVAGVNFEPSKPALPSPLWDVIGKIQRLEAASDDYATVREQQIKMDLKEIDRLHAEESLTMDKALAAQKDVTFWTVLQDVGNICMGSVSAVLGVFTFSSGNPVAGGLLIAAGITSIANIAFKYGKVWDWMAERIAGENQQLRETIRTYLPASVAVVCAALCVYGSMQVWNLPGLTSSQQALSMVETGLSVVTGVVGLGQGMSQAHLKWETAELSALQTMEEFTRMDLEDATEEIQEFQKRQSETQKVAAQLINSNSDALQLINQPV